MVASRALHRPLFILLLAALAVFSLILLNHHTNHVNNLEAPINGEPPKTQPGSAAFYWKLAISVAFVLLGGAFAGLTLGLMGLDQTNLKVLSQAAEEPERSQAARVLTLLTKGRHWVLVVLLLSNVIINESLPIFLDSILGGGIAAIAISTAMIVIFGEIIPQSVSVKYGLAIGAKAVPFVFALMYTTAPISWPIAKLLDWILGHEEGTTYKKAELKTFVTLHGNIGDEPLNEDEITIIGSVLELASKTVSQIMTPIADCYTLGADDILDEDTVTEILAQGYSRIPIHESGRPKTFLGMLLTKRLITYDPEDAKPVKSFQLSSLPETEPTVSCLDALNYFQTGRSHMLLVSNKPGEDGQALGLVSLEDVIEEMIGEEIVDETDVYVDVHNKVKVVRRPATKNAAAGHLGPVIKGIMERRRNTKLQRHNSMTYGAVDSTAGKVSVSIPKPHLTVEDADRTLSKSPDEHTPLIRAAAAGPEAKK